MKKRLLGALLLALGLCLAGVGTGPVPASAQSTAVLAYAAWAPNTWYAVGTRVTYDGVDYECVQAHTSLTGWEPPIVPALWKALAGGGGPGTGTPGQPGAPRVTGSSDTSISLSWTASGGTVTGYRVYEGTTQRAQVTGTTATIGSLGVCTAHTYTVRAYNSAGESAASAAVTGTTTGCSSGGALPRHILTGYWHNFVNPAVELKLSQVPRDYDVVAIAFGEATSTPGQVRFALDPGLSTAVGGYTEAQFKADVQALRQRGQKVILSVGGEAGHVQVAGSAAATAFANSVYSIMQTYGFDGVDIDLENGLNATYMAQALRELRAKAGSGLIIMMAPQTIDMQSTGMEYFKLALSIKDILTVVNMQYYNSGAMLGCDQKVYSQGSVDFMTALACIQLDNGLRPDQVGLGLPAGPGAAGGGVVSPAAVTNALNCLARRTDCGSFVPSRTYPDIRGAMTWSINWDASNNWNFSKTVKPFLATLP
ncbi:chitinase [Microbispora sp. NPDC004025]